MTAEKSLKFQFALDENSFNRVKRALDEMISKAQILAKTLQNVGGGGGGGLMGGGSVGGGVQPGQYGWMLNQQAKAPQTAIGKVVMDNANAFKNMANLGAASLKGLNDALKNSVEQQRNQISRLKESLESLAKTYERMGGSAGKNATAIQAKMVQVAGMISQGQANLQNMPAGSPLLPGIPWPGQGGTLTGVPTVPGVAPRGGGMGLLTPLGPGGVSGQGIAQWLMGNQLGAVVARSAGYIGAGVMGAVNMGQASNDMSGNVSAARGQAIRPAWERMKRADVTDAMAQKSFTSLGETRQIELLRKAGAPEAVAKDIAAGVARGVASGGSDISGITPESIGTENYKRLQAGIEQYQQETDWFSRRGRGLEYLNETRGSRLQARRILGLDMKGYGVKGDYQTWSDKQYAAGYDDQETMSAIVQARSAGGSSFANRYAGTVRSATAGGWGGVTEALAAAARASGNDKFAGAGVRAALGGGIDKVAGLQLAQSVFGFDPRGNVSGSGALKAIQQGFDFTGQGAQDLNTVSRIQLGMRSADQLAGGFDQYQRGMNLVSAIGAMPGGTTYAQDALAGRMSFKELTEVASGGSSARSRAYGIDKEAAMAQIGGMSRGLFSRYVEQGGNDMVSRTMRAMRESGQSEQDFMAGLGTKARGGSKEARAQLEALGVFASDLMGGDTEGGIGMVQALSGVKDLDKTKLKQGNIPGAAGLTADEQAKREAEIKERKESAEQARQALNDFVTSLKQNNDRLKGLTSFGSFSSSIDELTRKFMKLAGVTDEVIKKGEESTTAEALKIWTKGAASTVSKAEARDIDKGRVIRAGGPKY